MVTLLKARRLRRALFSACPALAMGMAASLSIGSAHAEDQAKPQSIWERDTLTGDWDGARTALKNKGIDITLNEIAETFDLLSGGIDRGASFEGRLEVSVDADLEKLAGWTRASAHVTVFQIHNGGHNIADEVGSLADPSNIDALATTRLFTAWFQQNLDNDRVSIRIGQLAADDEFFTSETGGGLINGTFGWATVLAANMLNGGPAYPLATPGVRVKVKPTDDFSVLTAVFSGDPAGSDCNDDPQQCNKHGTTFSFSGGALWMGELQYSVNQVKDAAGLPGVYKLGSWYATTDFADQHFGVNGAGVVVSLADPTAVGPLNHSGNWGFYGVADQMVWREDKRSLNLFLRGGVSPSDRNLVSYYVDGGFGFKALLPGRDDDVLTFGIAYSNISNDAVALDKDTLALSGPPFPIRDYELAFELSYKTQIAPWWTVQPDLQYIIHPGGNVTDPNNPASSVDNAFFVGVRSTMAF
ncbi:MAG: carbohydrate porin [Rhodomicrobiaceae bacterium]